MVRDVVKFWALYVVFFSSFLMSLIEAYNESFCIHVNTWSEGPQYSTYKNALTHEYLHKKTLIAQTTHYGHWLPQSILVFIVFKLLHTSESLLICEVDGLKGRYLLVGNSFNNRLRVSEERFH